MKLRVLSLNIHKGFSTGNRRFILPSLKGAFQNSGADLIFLQEVLGNHQRHAERIKDWPDQSQTEFLADSIWRDYSYGKNAIYDHGDHGNAILSRYPLIEPKNQDISSSRFEQRGFQFARIDTPRNPLPIINLHLSLLHRDRSRQMTSLVEFVSSHVKPDEPLIIAGDFNDWARKLNSSLEQALDVKEIFKIMHGSEARTYPHFCPILPLDRIYCRGFAIKKAEVLHQEPWNKLSDHLPLQADLEWN